MSKVPGFHIEWFCFYISTVSRLPSVHFMCIGMDSLKALQSNGTYIFQLLLSALVRVMGWLLFGAKLLPEPNVDLSIYQLNRREQHLVKLQTTIKYVSVKKMHTKCCLYSFDQVIQALPP